MRRFSSVSLKQIWVRKGRTLLTAAGIMLGVAILFGVLISNASSQQGVQRIIDDFTGRADVLVSPTGAFDSTMPEGVVAELASLPKVVTAVGSYSFRSSVQVPKEDEPEGIVVSGIDLVGRQKIHKFELAAGRYSEQGQRETILPSRFADRLGVSLGDTIEAGTRLGLERLTITGILEDTGAARVGEGEILFTSLETARKINGVGAVFRTVSLVLSQGVEVDPWIAAHRDAAGPGLDFENASTLAQQFQKFLAGLGAGFTSFAAVALFVGAFLIYLTLTMAVVERTQFYGVLRALGATRRQLFRMVVLEALAMGVISTAAGLLLGLALAKGLLILVGNLFELELRGLEVPLTAVAAASAVGVLVTLAASAIPARRAARLSPVTAIRGDSTLLRRLSRSWIIGIPASLAGIWLAFKAPSQEAGFASFPLILFGGVLLTPLLLRPLASLLGTATKRVSRGGGDVAVLHLVKERSRSAFTLALIMVVMAMIFSNGGIQASLKRSITGVLDRIFGADLTVHSVGARMPAEIADELAEVKGVAAVTPVRFGIVTIPGLPNPGRRETPILVVDPETYFEVESLTVEGLTEDGLKRGLSGDGVIVSKSLSEDLGEKRGASITIRGAKGNVDLGVSGVFESLPAGFGPGIIMGLPAAVEHLRAGDPGEFHLRLAERAEAARVRSSIQERLRGRYRLEFETPQSIKDEADRQLRQFSNIFLAILLVAAVIGLLGLANTLAMSVAQRAREIGVLRAVGTTRGQVRRMVLVESLTLGLVAFALSIPLGWLMSRLSVVGMKAAMGFDVSYVYPAAWVPFVAAFGIIVAAGAALGPARRAARLQVVEALRFE